MDLRVLKYFLTVAREKSITRAAENLYITQPTLSRQIAELEKELGTPLFVRNSRSVTLTDAGLLLKRRVEEMLAIEDKINEEFVENYELSGTISIGMAESVSANIVADLIEIFRKKYPEVKYELFTATADQITERIDKGLLDIGFMLEPVNIEKYDFIRLPETEKLGILMKSDDALAQKQEIEPCDLLGRPLIVPVRRELQQSVRSAIGSDYDKFNIIATFNVVNNAILLAERRIGYVLLTNGATLYHHNVSFVFRPIKSDSVINCVAVWKKFQPAGRAVSQFLEELKMLIRH